MAKDTPETLQMNRGAWIQTKGAADEIRFDPPLPLPLNETAQRLFDLVCAYHAALSKIAEIAYRPGGVGQIARDALRICK